MNLTPAQRTALLEQLAGFFQALQQQLGGGYPNSIDEEDLATWNPQVVAGVLLVDLVQTIKSVWDARLEQIRSAVIAAGGVEDAASVSVGIIDGGIGGGPGAGGNG